MVAAAEKLRGCYIESNDAMQCIRDWDTPQTFFYCDPPYVGTIQEHYAGYTEKDLLALCQALDGCRGSFILSSYGNDICDSFGWAKKEFSATTSVNNTGTVKDKKRIECVWMRGPSEERSEAMRKILERPEFDVFDGVQHHNHNQPRKQQP
jgi:DNA adenine methylase